MTDHDILRHCARKAARPLYLVGGALRDRLLGRPSLDLDLVCEEPARALALALSRSLDARLVVLDDVWRIYRLILPAKRQLDLAELQGGSIEADLARRDFTVNALARQIHPRAGRILDPFGGLRDLDRARLRAVSENAFRADPLRLLRAYRIAAELGFRIEPATEGLIRRRARLIRRTAPERIQSELMRLLSVEDSGPWLQRMDSAGLLTRVFPELEPSRRCAHVYYGKKGVLGHSLKTVHRLDGLLSRLGRLYPDLLGDLKSYLEKRPPSWLRLTALLHDVAKPRTARLREGRLRFFGHEEWGGRIAEKVLGRLRFSQAQIRSASLMIAHHLRPGNLAANPTVSDKAAFRYFKDLGEEGLGLLLVCWADYASYLTPARLESILPRRRDHPNEAVYDRLAKGVRKTLRHLQVVGWLMEARLKRPEIVVPPKLVDGHDVMKVLGVAPGPRVGEILEAIRELQAEGKVRDREGALAEVQRLGAAAPSP